MTAPLVLLCAGGTGGHLFPAEALAAALARRGVVVDLATDERAEGYGHDFPARAIHIIPSATIGSRSPIAFIKASLTLMKGYWKSRNLISRLGPRAVVGFGGYPTLPPMWAATQVGAPSIIHDQNAVMGRANRQLSSRVTAIATSFPDVLASRPDLAAKATFTGNPVRARVLAAAETPYDPPQPGGAFRLVVFGGSQGARVMSDIVPPAIEMLDPALRARLIVTQQARAEDQASVREHYEELGVRAEIAPFFSDLPQKLASAHLVIGRSGASTVAELAVIGRPAILVPLPHALDNDQLLNAKALAASEAAILIRQSDFTPDWLAAELTRLLNDPTPLIAMAQHAKAQGHADAAERLADLVMTTAGLS